MLLGLLYCSSNKVQRAEKFYELVEIELSDILHISDPEFRDFIPVMFEIAYILMFKLYSKHRYPRVRNKKGDQLTMPHVEEIENFLPTFV